MQQQGNGEGTGRARLDAPAAGVLVALLAAGVWLALREAPESTVDVEATAPTFGFAEDAAGVAGEAALPTSGGEADVVEAGASSLLGSIAGEARRHVESLTARRAPLPAESADAFVGGAQALDLLPKALFAPRSVEELLSTLGPEARVGVVRRTREGTPMTPPEVARHLGADLATPLPLAAGPGTLNDVLDDWLRDPTARVVLRAADGTAQPRDAEEVLRAHGLDLDAGLEVLVEGALTPRSAREVLRAQAAAGGEAVTVVAERRRLEETTVGALAAEYAEAPATQVEVVTTPHGLPEATVAELIGATAGADDLYYVRTVQQGDRQGLWGIVQWGLLENFARGVALRRGEALATYRVAIPAMADEPTDAAGSSFLGRLIQRKVTESHVYNLALGRMGTNADLVHPGQQLVIVHFPMSELVAIYEHFVALETH